MSALIDWDQTREMPFIFPSKFLEEKTKNKNKKNPWHTTNVNTSITI